MTTQTPEPQLSYSIRQAAGQTGMSESSVRRAIDEGHLAVSYPKGSTKPVVLHEQLIDWLHGED